MSAPRTAHDFVRKWQRIELKERSAAQAHFRDICHLLDQPTPEEADPTGSWFCFEKGATKTTGGDGWADVWMRAHFGWEYKGKGKDLNAAYAQLQRYAPALENPPLLIVSDMDRIVVHTNWTNTVTQVREIPLEKLPEPEYLQVLRWAFTEPERLKPGTTTEDVTRKAAGNFARLAQRLRERGYPALQVAHFLNRLVFCLFAEDAQLLPANVFTRALEATRRRPETAEAMLRDLFRVMHKGGNFGPEYVEWFNGGLFDSDDALPLERDDIDDVLEATRLDWSSIEPSIFGTLFERGLDPSKRAQLGAHYTDAGSILKIVNPVIKDPLLDEWGGCKARIAAALGRADQARSPASRTRARREAEQIFQSFNHRLSQFRALDPACGSGNFLYLALQTLKDIEHRAALEAEQLGLGRGFTGMNTGVHNVHGIEVNEYAAELARLTVWIGEIQWMLRHGVQPTKNPILQPLQTIECRDAVLNQDGTEPEWPKADVIIGNPPFLGDKRMRNGLGDSYTEALRNAYRGRVPGAANLVIYWFEKARAHIANGNAKRAGLVSTNTIRQSVNRRVLERILAEGAIRNAWSDEKWINEGAAVRVSIVCFDAEDEEGLLVLNGREVREIYADLTAPSGHEVRVDVTKSIELPENQGWSFFGLALSGRFTVTSQVAREWLVRPNPHGRPNSEVLRPLWNGVDLTGRWSERWVIDFGTSMSEEEAAHFEAPFAYIEANVKSVRAENREASRAKYWWRHGRPRPELRRSLEGLGRYVATSEKSKHRIFVWLPTSIAPDHRLIAFPRDDDAFFGLLSSRIHVCWALAAGSTLEDRPAYATRTCFDRFPFPNGLAPNLRPSEYTNSHAAAIGSVAARLSALRESWLNPPEWTERVPEVVPGFPERIVTRPGCEASLKLRTLTNLYNERPAWLRNVHDELDAAVARAYGWTDYTAAMPDEEILSRLIELNRARSGAPATST